MDRSIKYSAPLIAVLCTLLFQLGGCVSKKEAKPLLSGSDSIAVIRSILAHRAEMEEFFRSSPYSPFAGDPAVRFEGIKWFPPNLEYYLRSTLMRYPRAETVSVFGTKGEERREMKYGYFEFFLRGKTFRLNTYRSIGGGSSSEDKLLSVWFTDATTNRETYGVGRYLEVGEEHAGTDSIYTIDFNNAYNPYCAYSARYSCAIPRREDHLDISILAGELKYHP